MSTAAETIEKMNSSPESLAGIQLRQGGTPPAESATPPETPPAAAVTPPATTPPVVTAPAKTPESTPPGQPPATAGDGQDKDIPDDIFYSQLSKLTDGHVKSQEDFKGLIKQRNELLEQAKKGFEPKFANERAKWAHELLSKSGGDELQAAQRTIRALAYNPEGKDGKDTLFEKFLLDPKNSDLSPAKALEYFNAEYDSEYGEMEGNLVKQRKHDLAVREAKENILKFQTEFKTFDEQPRQIAKQVEEGVANSVKGLKELKISLSNDPSGTEALNVAVDDPQELQMLHDMILDPTQAYNDLVAKFETETGFNYDAFRDEMYQRANHKKLREMAFEEGKKLGRLETVNKARNASNPKDISNAGAPAGTKPTTREQAWAQAAGV